MQTTVLSSRHVTIICGRSLWRPRVDSELGGEMHHGIALYPA